MIVLFTGFCWLSLDGIVILQCGDLARQRFVLRGEVCDFGSKISFRNRVGGKIIIGEDSDEKA